MNTLTQWYLLIVAQVVAFSWPVKIEPRTRKRVLWVRFKRLALVYIVALVLGIILGFLKGWLGL